jgi:hypothetical protein
MASQLRVWFACSLDRLSAVWPSLTLAHLAVVVCCSQVQLFFKEPEQWAQVLGAAIPQTSNFFLNYVITRAFMLNPVRLLMPRECTNRPTLLACCV